MGGVVVKHSEWHPPRTDVGVIARTVRVLVSSVPVGEVTSTGRGVVLNGVIGVCHPEGCWSDVIIL